MIARGVRTFIDTFDRAQVLSTTPGQNGWTVKDTSAAGAPTYLVTTDEGLKLTLAATSEAEIVTAYQNDVLIYDLASIQHLWWILKVSGVDAATTLVAGLASAQNDTPDSVQIASWFRLEGSASTSAIVVESDDNVTNKDDVATGKTLGSVFKKCLMDFTYGLADVRFFIDGERVAETQKFDLSGISAGQNVQPFVQLQKASGTGVPSVSIAQFGCQYEWAYGES